MDFEKLLAKADSNAKKLNKKVDEANYEIELDRQRKLQRLKQAKQLEKEELKRRLPPPPKKKEVCFNTFVHFKSIFSKRF